MSASTEEGPALDAEARALLNAFRADETLPDDVSARVLNRLHASGALEATTTAPRPAPTRTRWWIPATTVALAAAAAVLLWRADMFAATQDAAHAPVQARDQADTSHAPGVPSRPAGAPRVPPHKPGPIVAPADLAPPDVVPALEGPGASPPVAPPTAATKPRGTRRPAKPALDPGSETTAEPTDAPAPVATSSLAAETRSLAKAQAAVAAGRYTDALQTIATAEQRFPAGVLREERSALRAVALCESGAAGAQRAAAAFAKAHPASALRTRVQNACEPD